MPRYYFDFHDGEHFTCDDEGVECMDFKAAQHAAIAVLPNIAWDELPDGNRRDFTVKVRDESGRSLFQASLSLVAERRDGGAEDRHEDGQPPYSYSAWSA